MWEHERGVIVPKSQLGSRLTKANCPVTRHQSIIDVDIRVASGALAYGSRSNRFLITTAQVVQIIVDGAGSGVNGFRCGFEHV